jgi:hypothetical protein
MTQPNLRKNTLVKGRMIKRPAKKFGNIRPFIYRERLYGAHYANVSAQQKNPMLQHHQAISQAVSPPISASPAQFWIIGLVVLLRTSST